MDLCYSTGCIHYIEKGCDCMVTKMKLPIGIEFFKDIRTRGYYYVDKTGFIMDLLDSCGSVNLFTRPRRFGKSLNMDMLKTFFEIGAESSLFDGLCISKASTIWGSIQSFQSA